MIPNSNKIVFTLILEIGAGNFFEIKNTSLKQSFYSQLPANIYLSLYPKKLEKIKSTNGANRKSPNQINTSFYSRGYIYT